MRPEPETSKEHLDACTKGRVQRAPADCVICGRTTNYHHYDAASCNGCRTFFRRTLLLRKSYRCIGIGLCRTATIRNCRACRFDQCILAGMNVEAMKVPSQGDRDVLGRAITERAKALLSRQQQSITFTPEKSGWTECKEIDALINVEARSSSLREQFDPWPLYSQSLKDNLERPVQLSNLEEYRVPITTIVRNMQTGTSMDMRDMGWTRVWASIDIFFCLEAAKTLPLFRRLDIDDKIIVWQDVSSICVMATRAFFSFSRSSPVVIMPDDTTLISPVSLTGMEEEVFVRCLEPFQRVRPTVEELALMKALICTSAGTGKRELSAYAKQVLTEERTRYAGTLLKHLQHKGV
ncbi:nuclear receptor NHR-60 [Aphelenchoides avenae]|nr:nuclear receptor NHR-60 [Aphelenchus avenae]